MKICACAAWFEPEIFGQPTCKLVYLLEIEVLLVPAVKMEKKQRVNSTAFLLTFYKRDYSKIRTTSLEGAVARHDPNYCPLLGGSTA